MSWSRVDRLNALIKEKVATVVLERLADPRLGFVTITSAELNQDRSRCLIKYSVLGDEAKRRTTHRALQSAAPHVQEIIAPSLRMRHMPELVFELDDGLEKGERVLDLLRQIEGEHGDGAVPSSDEGRASDAGEDAGELGDERASGDARPAAPPPSSDDADDRVG